VECGQLTAFPSAINNSGVIVGAAHAIDSSVNSGFVYTNGTCTSTNFGGRGTDFAGITDLGAVLGILSSTSSFELKDGSLTALPTYPNAYSSYIGWKNASGTLAGNFQASSSNIYGRGFLYLNGNFDPLPEGLLGGTGSAFTLTGLNDNNIAVGTFYGYAYHGFVLRDGNVSFITYPGASYTTVNGINNHDVLVGTFVRASNNTFNVFTYDLSSKTFTNLNWPDGYNAAIPVGITDSGEIAAMYTASGGLLIATPAGN
jgi:hypothetical protein